MHTIIKTILTFGLNYIVQMNKRLSEHITNSTVFKAEQKKVNEHIEKDMKEIKTDVRETKTDIKEILKKL